MTVTVEWRAGFANDEIHALHAEAFETRRYDETEWDWVAQVERYSLGWVVARVDGRFVGFVNVLWDGLVHAFIEDVMVDASVRGQGVGVRLVHAARDGAAAAGCEYLHVGFDDDLRAFYVDACGFAPTGGGLMVLAGGPSEWSRGLDLAINVSIRFPDIGFADRPGQAASLGFVRMESWWPFDGLVPSDEERGRFVSSVRAAGQQLVLLNTFAGDMAAGDRGLATMPDRHDDFVENLHAALTITAELDCPNVHVMLGNREGRADDEVDAAAFRNLALAAQLASASGRRIVIEVLNGVDNGDYVLRDLDRGIRWVEEVRRRTSDDAIGLLFDAYHLTMLGEDLADAWSRARHVATHVQVADVPGRGAPGTGTIEWAAFGEALRASGYRGIVSFEHR